MTNFLKNIFTKKSFSSSQCEIFRPTIGGSYSDSKSTEYYKSFVYICSKMNSQTVADTEFKLLTHKAPKVAKFKKLDYQTTKKNLDPNTVEIVEHPILELLRNPNSNDTLYDFVFKIESFLSLTGDSYIWVQRDSSGIPIQMDVLYSQFVNIIHNGANEVVSYNYGIAIDGKFKVNFAPEEILHIKNFDPGDEFYGTSPLEACARSQDLINSMSTYEESLNRNLGIPAGIVKYSSQNIKPDQRTQIEQAWQKKFASVGRAGKVLVTGVDMNYETIGIGSREMAFLEGRQWSRDEIFGCFGVPLSLVYPENANFSTLNTTRSIY
jgi:HK97 family phage portal protein